MKTSSSNKESPNNEVSPDFCIQDQNKGIVGEVKKSFPNKRELWMDDFKQLMCYDDDLNNWLTSSGKIEDHEIVLLPEQSRSRAVINYFEEQKKNGKIKFKKNFIIVEFNRNDQADTYYFFRKEYGDLKYFKKINSRLSEGIPVPMSKLMLQYEKIKLYDSQPPLPYLLHLIWENVIMFRASSDKRFASIRMNGKSAVNITINEIVEELYRNYSFRVLNSDNDSHQPKIPLTSWTKEAVEALTTFKLAKPVDVQKGEYIIYFKKFRETLKKFISLCKEYKLGLENEEKQMELFDSKKK